MLNQNYAKFTRTILQSEIIDLISVIKNYYSLKLFTIQISKFNFFLLVINFTHQSNCLCLIVIGHYNLILIWNFHIFKILLDCFIQYFWDLFNY